MTTLLLVDDNPECRKGLSRGLSASGMIVETAESGREAIKKFEPGRYDGLIVDISLGDMTGIDLIREIRKKDSRIGIVIVTGRNRKYIEDAADGLGVWCVLEKPVDITVLISKIENAVALTHLPQSLEDSWVDDLEEEAQEMRAISKDLSDETTAGMVIVSPDSPLPGMGVTV
jgi:DNA-binding response OmpR family regulator